MNKFLIVMTTFGLALATPVWAHKDRDRDRDHGESRPIQERRALKPDARIQVRNVQGSIEVEAWNRNELELTGELGPDVEKLEITGNESSLRIEVKLPKDNDHDVDGDTTLRLRVPAGVTLEAEGVSADVTVKGLTGPVTAESVSGDVRLDVESARLEASSVSGDVEADAPATESRVSSVSGDVTVRRARGELRCETVSGEINIQGSELRSLEAKSVSGDLDLDIEPARDAEIRAETLSGEVRMILPSEPDGRVRVETYSGEIDAAWWRLDDEEQEIRRDGKGKGSLYVQSFSGDIELREKGIVQKRKDVEVRKDVEKKKR